MKSDHEILSRAQDLVYQAWEAQTASRRKALAQEALKISPLCGDAYNVLAGLEPKPDAAYRLYQKGLDAAQAALGREDFEDAKGHFWGLLETRPYMRAREGMARSLWALGDLKHAANHYEAMLELNPNDNQGMRYELAAVYLESSSLSDLKNLLKRYKGEITAIWKYTEALVAFKDLGDSAKSSKALAAAVAQNLHVPAYLLGQKKIPKKMPGYMGLGDETEAQYYALLHGKHWTKVPGALAWLRVFVENSKMTQQRPAAKDLWESIPEGDQAEILANIWCGQCKAPGKALINGMAVKSGDLILKGQCVKCNGPVTRLLETSET